MGVASRKGACPFRRGRGLGWHLLARTAQPCLAWSPGCPAHTRAPTVPCFHPPSTLSTPILGWVCEHWTMYVCCGLENSIAGCKADRRVSSGGRRCYRLVWAAMGVCVGDGREALNRGLPPLALHAIPSPIHPQSSRQGSARATQGEKSVPNFVARPGRGWGKTFPGWHLGTASGSCLLRGLFCN